MTMSVSVPCGNAVGVKVSGVPEAPRNNITYGRRNGTWVDLTSPANLQVRRGTAAEVGGITPLEAEPVWVTDKKHLVVGDGATEGGINVLSAFGVQRVIVLTSTAYTAIESPDVDTLYVVTE